MAVLTVTLTAIERFTLAVEQYPDRPSSHHNLGAARGQTNLLSIRSGVLNG